MAKKKSKNNIEASGSSTEMAQGLLTALENASSFLADVNDEKPIDPKSEEMTAEFGEVLPEMPVEESDDFLAALTDADEEENAVASDEAAAPAELSGTELEDFDAADIEELEFVEDQRLESIIESILFASDRPVSLNSIKMVFKGTNVKTDKIKRMIDQLQVEYAGSTRGVVLEEVSGGYQLRTKVDNMEFLRRTLKARTFRLSGPALEVLSIVAYKQPTIKSEIDEIRGVESGHLLRALMEKGLVNFEGKSELPGRPMQYGTTRKFLEIFGLRNLRELPTLSQIDEILPEGISEEEGQKLSDVTASLSEQIGTSFSQGEEELTKITEQLEDITTSSDFFEQEKVRQKQKKESDKAQNIREAIAVGEHVPNRDVNWLARYEEALTAGEAMPAEETAPVEALVASDDSSESLFEQDAAHSEDELPFYEEADEDHEDGSQKGTV